MSQQPSNRRQKVVDAMAKKFADHGIVEQIIIKHRKSLLRSGNTLYIIIGVTVGSMILTALFTAGIVQPPQSVIGKNMQTVKVKNSFDILLDDYEAGMMSADQFVLYCKDYLIRYDSLPVRYQTPFSTTSSGEVYGVIVDIWPSLSLRTRQRMLKELPRIEIEQRQRNMEPQRQAMHNGTTR